LHDKLQGTYAAKAYNFPDGLSCSPAYFLIKHCGE
jgi:hypothetical protein